MYRVIKGVTTEGYKGLQGLKGWVMRGYRGSQGNPRGYGVVQLVKGGLQVFTDVTRNYRLVLFILELFPFILHFIYKTFCF